MRVTAKNLKYPCYMAAWYMSRVAPPIAIPHVVVSHVVIPHMLFIRVAQ